MTDVGLRLLESLYEQMMIDDDWAVRRERGFTWWAYRLPQHVEVGPPVWSEDRFVCSVRIWTEVVQEVDPSTDPATLLAAINPSATLNALVWDPSKATIAECCTATVHDEIFVWLSKVLATAAVLQNTAAHSRAHSLAGLTGGVPAASNHPHGGERAEMDGLLNVPEHVIAPAGAEPSQYIGAHFEHVEQFLGRMRFLGSADSEGLTCEVPFSGSTPSMVISAVGQLQTSLVQMFTDAPHPEAGNGLLCIMRLPYSADPQQIAEQANYLNLVESRGDTGTLLLGAWCPDPSSDTTLVFCQFVPNLLAERVLVENLISYMSSHSRLAAGCLGASPDLVTGSATLGEQVRDLVKSTGKASSQIALSAAKLGIAKLRKRFTEGGR